MHCLAVLARWAGDKLQAIAYLEAQRLAEEIGSLGEQWQILTELGKLYQSNGEMAKAREAFERAAEIVQALAAKIDDAQLRAKFLASEPVRSIIHR